MGFCSGMTFRIGVRKENYIFKFVFTYFKMNFLEKIANIPYYFVYNINNFLLKIFLSKLLSNT